MHGSNVSEEEIDRSWPKPPMGDHLERPGCQGRWGCCPNEEDAQLVLSPQ